MKNILKASGFSLPVPHKGFTPRYLQRLPLYGVAFPNPRPPGSRAGLKDKKTQHFLPSLNRLDKKPALESWLIYIRLFWMVK